MPILTTGSGVYPTIGGGGGGTTTWNPLDTDANTTLSGGNLTATTASGALAHSGFRSIASHSSGKFYSEHTIVVDNGFSGYMGIGVTNAGRALTETFAGAGAGGQSYGFHSVGTPGDIYASNSAGNVASYTAYVQGDVVSMAVDFDNSKIWWRINGGNWYNNGLADPSTNTGGLSFSTILTSGPFFATMTQLVFTATAQKSTTNFGATAYSFTPPSGFGNW